MNATAARARMDELVGQIYEAASGVGSWEGVSKGICDVFDLDSYTVHTRRFSATGLPVPDEMLSLHGVDLKAMLEYVAHYNQVDPVGHHMMAQTPLETVLPHELLDRRELARTEYWNDFVKPNKLLCTVGSWAPLEDGAILALGGHRVSRLPYKRRELEDMRAMHGHLQRAANIHLRRPQLAGGAELMERLMGSLAFGVLEVGRGLRIHHANAAAEHMMKRGDGLHSSQQRLCAQFPADDERLRRALGTVWRGETAAESLAIRRRSGNSPYRLDLLAPPRLSLERRGLVLVTDSARPLALRSGLLRAAFGLTPAEERVALAIAGDATLQDIADCHRVKLGTVRNQLKRVLEKTGVRRQSELVGLLHRLAGSVG